MLFNPNEEKSACGVGFVVNTKGVRSNVVLKQAEVMLSRMDHRGACACDETTGDGAGVMTGIPHELYARFASEANVELPSPGHYAMGLVFVQKGTIPQEVIQNLDQFAGEFGLTLLFWRRADVRPHLAGAVAKIGEPVVLQIFVVPKTSGDSTDRKTFRGQIYLLRKYASHRLQNSCYICSLSPDTVVYKGMFTTAQLWAYYADLQQPEYRTHFAMVHNRFSTNTLPTWDRAHPQRMIAHNGEINTLRGNVNFCNARQSVMESRRYPKELLQKLYPIIEAGMSDSGSFDNLLEFLYEAGEYSLPEAVMMMIPEAWHNLDPSQGDIPQTRWNFYKWAANSMEPWDGPALVVFSDGRYVGAVLDRNGLRPARFYATDDNMVYMSSEVGVVDVLPNARVIQKGRLKAGRLLIVDTQVGALLDDESLKQEIVEKYPYGDWLKTGAVTLEQLHEAAPGLEKGDDQNEIAGDPSEDRRLPLFGFTMENITLLLTPMLKTDKEALGSMGNDAPLACLSEQNPLVFDYFQQLFAQVTNPPIDPFRERNVMTLTCPIGPQQNILIHSDRQTNRLWLSTPLLTLEDLRLLRSLNGSLSNASRTSQVYSWRSHVLDATYEAKSFNSSTSLGSMLQAALDRLCSEAEQAIRSDNVQILIISDRAAGPERIPLPSMLALGAVHQRLLRQRLRMQVALIVESGEVKEVHHFCTLIGFGADGICPYLLFESVARFNADGILTTCKTDLPRVYQSLKNAVVRGIFKVMAKMGISTLHSYKGAQIFEAVGLADSVIQMCFTGAASRIGGADFDMLAKESRARHALAYPETQSIPNCLGLFANNPGFYHWRQGGESHMNDPETVAKLQAASQTNSKEAYKLFVRAADESSRHCTLRGQFDFRYTDKPIPLDSVEPASEIVKRFSTGAMSLGSISPEAHQSLALAMNRIGARSNTGEGGEGPGRYLNKELRSSIKQVASARFGVNSSYLAHADMLQIKMAQGAKPGEGGELPGYKVTEEIAKTRHSVPGVGLISPPPHHDIYSIEDLSQLIYDLKSANPYALVSVKLVSEVGVGVVAAGVAKARAVHITISGHDGGTGASSWTGIKHAGLPWELGIAEAHQILVHQRTRSRVMLQVDGQIRTGRDVIIAALLGADEMAMSTAPLIVLGCTMMRKCHLNTCPVGIATQDPVLRRKFAGCPEHVINYLFMLAEEVREYMSKLGVTHLEDLIGRTEYLMPIQPSTSPKASLLNLSSLLIKTEPMKMHPTWTSVLLDDGLPDLPSIPSTVDSLIHCLPKTRSLDIAVLTKAKHLIETPADQSLDSTQPAVVTYSETITNEDRTALTTLSYAISDKFSEEGLPPGRLIKLEFFGSAGQSFCAFLVRGVEVRLEGDANDYVAKGLSGGHVTIVPPRDLLSQGFKSEANLIVGNVCLYGAICGQLFLRGQAAERFCVRNSGATVVVEGVGDHGCEYMTGGRAVILGRTGRNFAAGMSGGLAFVHEPDGVKGPFARKCNMELVDLEPMTEENTYAPWLKSIIREFTEATGSEVGAKLLTSWDKSLTEFILVFPRDYRRALEAMKESKPVPEANHKTKPSIKDIEDMVGGDVHAPLDKLRGFVKYMRDKHPYRDAKDRLSDWEEVYAHQKVRQGLRKQAARCMDCGVPFCQSHMGCPLGNLIPNWNELVFKEDWLSAHQALAQTNNFPEFTGRVCPAPCEGACVLGINADPVAIKSIECAIADKGWDSGWWQPMTDQLRPPTGKRIAIVGSGPAGLACADQLNKAGHEVTVFERRNKPGGLMRYGIPTMKLGRGVLDRRLALMQANGVKFVVNTRICASTGHKLARLDLNKICQDPDDCIKEVPASQLLDEFDAVVLCLGATWPRDINIPGRNLNGIHFAMSFLERWQRKQQKQHEPNGRIGQQPNEQSTNDDSLVALANGKRVVILGGGDTGVDCMATSVRQGAQSVVNLEILPPPPPTRNKQDNPWPEYPRVWRVEYGHDEVTVRFGRDPRKFNVITKEFLDDGKGGVAGLRIKHVEWAREAPGGPWKMQEVPDSEETIDCDLVLLAMGFVGPEDEVLKELSLNVKEPQCIIETKPNGSYATNVPRVYTAGDCHRGQSLVVHAINEGRQAARQVDLDLMGYTPLPGPGGLVRAFQAQSS